jgi:hypothetical protein
LSGLEPGGDYYLKFGLKGVVGGFKGVPRVMVQMGESIHATKSSIGRKLAPILPKSRRLWKIVEQYEMMNHVETSRIAKQSGQN